MAFGLNRLASIPWQGLDTRPYTPGMYGGGTMGPGGAGGTGPILAQPGGGGWTTPSVIRDPGPVNWPSGMPSPDVPPSYQYLGASPAMTAPVAPTFGAAPAAVSSGWAPGPIQWQGPGADLTGQLGTGSFGSQPIVPAGQNPISAAINRASFQPARQQATPGMGSFYAGDTTPQQRKWPVIQS